MSRGLALGLLLACVVGLILRLPRLEQRPLHTDESVHAYKFLELWQQGTYRYDPDEYHGPSLYYATLPFVWASGARTPAALSEATLRLVPVAFGLGLILLLPLLADGLGRAATVWAGCFTAVSTAFVYYSRYYIHEMALVCFALLFGAALWRYWRQPGMGWAALAGLGLGLMHATKETVVFHLAALGCAAVGLLWFAEDGRRSWQELRARLRPAPIATGFAVAAFVSITLFTSCFTNASGPLDSWRTYLPWLTRAGGESPHIHPWHFYLERLFWFHPGKGPVSSELLIGLLALGGMATGLVPARHSAAHRGLARFLTFYTLTLALAYSVVAYKTPWCALGFLHGAILLAGIGAAALFRWIRPTWLLLLAGLVVVGATVQLAAQARRASREFATDQRNPYVYAHTSKDLLRLVERIRGVARVHGSPSTLAIHVMAPGGDYWPLPWYLRGFPEVTWSAGIPEDPFAPIVVASARLNAALDEKSDKRWLSVGYYEQRPRVFLEMFVELELWKRYVETLPRNRDDDDEDAEADDTG
jgi:uncharacterized protein (TIGR03663 family)